MPDSDIEALRLRAVEAAGRSLGVKFQPQSNKEKEGLFASDAGERLCAMPSKHYADRVRKGEAYWYTLRRPRRQFLEQSAADAHLVLACEGLPHAYLFGWSEFARWIGPSKPRGQHIFIAENHKEHAGWQMHFGTADSQFIPLAPYAVSLDNGNGGPHLDEYEDDEEDVRQGEEELIAAERPTSPLAPPTPSPSEPPAEGRGDEAKPPAQGRGRGTEPPTSQTRGPHPKARGYSGSYDPNQTAYTYLLRFANSTIWKVGWAHNVERRLKDINAHIPDELLAKVAGLRAPALWQDYTRQEWTTARQAYAMEQAILLALKAQGFATRRERAACSLTDMMRVWNGERDKHLS